MRLTYSVATAATNGMLHIPLLPHPAEYYSDGKNRLDEAKARADLTRLDGAVWSSKDGRAEMTMAIDFLDAVREAVDALIKSEQGVEPVRAGDGSDASRAGRKMKRGKVAYSRVEFRQMADGVMRCKVTAENPKGVVGHSENAARAFAQLFADILLAASDEMKAATGCEFALIDGGLAEGVFADARARTEAKARRETARACQWRCNGYCRCPPPCKCANYHIGRCEPPKEDKE